MKLEENETEEEFAERTQCRMARESELFPTNFVAQDIIEYRKRLAVEEERRKREDAEGTRTRRGGKTSAQLDNMALKVKELFPQVPLHIIRKDLERTEAVELTASNIVEDRLPYTPEAASVLASSLKPVASDPSSWKLTYDQRKWATIEENRRKYLERKERQKHI